MTKNAVTKFSSIISLLILVILPLKNPVAFVAPLRVASSVPSAGYPIKELGNCRNQTECKAYCDNPDNAPACWSYGTYKRGQVLGTSSVNHTDNTALESKLKTAGVTFPIQELGGCTSLSECKAYCDTQANHLKCTAFAEKYGISDARGTFTAVELMELVARARLELGCTTLENCRKLCEKSPAPCSNFLKRYQASKGRIQRDFLLEKAKKELGCTTLDACRTICAKDTKRCDAFVRKFNLNPATGEIAKTLTVIQEKSGCITVAECRSWCEKNPDVCPGFPLPKTQTSESTGAKTIPDTHDQSTKTVSPAP